MSKKIEVSRKIHVKLRDKQDDLVFSEEEAIELYEALSEFMKRKGLFGRFVSLSKRMFKH